MTLNMCAVGAGKRVHLTDGTATLCGRPAGRAVMAVATCSVCLLKADTVTPDAAPVAAPERPRTARTLPARRAVAAPVSVPVPTPDAGKLVDLYLRKSKVVSEGTDALSIEAQEVRGREWAAREGLTVRHVWKDNLSGYRDIVRPEFDKALVAVERGEVETLWCAALDRFSRRGARHIIPLMTEGARFYFDWERLDSADPRDFRMILWRAEDAKEYSDRLSANVSGAKARMRDAGAWTTKAPYGTRVVGTKVNRRLVPDASTWPTVVKIYRESAHGASSRMLAYVLNHEGTPAPSGGEWGAPSVNKIVNNPVYEGWITRKVGDRLVPYMNANGERVRTFAPDAETIPADLAAKARDVRTQTARGDRRNTGRGMPGVAGVTAHLLTGITHCASCTARMPVSGRSHVCGSRLQGKPCAAPASAHREYLEAHVAEMWVGHLTALDLSDPADAVRLAVIAERWNALHRPEETAEVSEVRDRVKAAERRLERLRGDRDAGLFDGPGGTDDYARRYREALAVWQAASERLGTLAGGVVTVTDWDPSEVLAAWERADTATRRDLLRLAVDRITVTRAARRGAPWDGPARVRITWAGDPEV